jgi:hypothetical protein
MLAMVGVIATVGVTAGAVLPLMGGKAFSPPPHALSAAKTKPPAASRQPPAASRQPPAASRQPPAASRQFCKTSHHKVLHMFPIDTTLSITDTHGDINHGQVGGTWAAQELLFL